ncbi:MAG: DUF1588 domain-containing protein, partial [Verrucomicrobiota bacterium]
GFQLWVNERDSKKEATIDGYVVSTNDPREMSGKIFLVGGRAYPLQLDFFKRTNKKDQGKKAEIELMWKTPSGTLETIPSRHLIPAKHAECFIPEVVFPADDRSVGYERGTSVSRAWLDAVNLGAIEAADYVGEHLDGLAKTKHDAEDRHDKIKTFARDFYTRSQRVGKLSDAGQRVFDLVWASADNPETAVRKVVILSMTSPAFLYPGVAEKNMTDQEKIISRLSLALWDSLPDANLRNKAATGWFRTLKNLDQLTWQMMEQSLTKEKLRQFFHHWLELDRAADVAKSETVFPEFSDAIMADLKVSLETFIDDTIWNNGSDYRKLLTADYVYSNETLSSLYPSEKPVKGHHFRKVQLKGGQRSGVLTHPYLLTNLAYHDNTSPIHRGVFMTRHILGIALKSPPMANEFLNDEFDPHLTMREKVTELTKAENCMSCHSTINPLGFSLEHFDGIGRWRHQDQGREINSKSTLTLDNGDTIQIQSPADVAKFAVEQPSAHLAFVESLFHHTVKQPAAAYDAEHLEWLRTSFVEQNFSVLDLLKQIAFSTAKEGLDIGAMANLSPNQKSQ